MELARYEYNGRGERVAKQTATEAYLYAYDESGQLIGRYVPEGATDWRIDEEILWLDSTPIASVRMDNGHPLIRAIHSDHLNSPRALTSLHGDSPPQGTTVWRWPLTTGETGGNNAYGTEQALEDPDGDGTRVVFHLRFPGQQYDGESGLHYNYFRDYEAGVARYVESDPIGLWGGLATFAYSESAPNQQYDELGLVPSAAMLEAMIISAAGRCIAGAAAGFTTNVGKQFFTCCVDQCGYRDILSCDWKVCLKSSINCEAKNAAVGGCIVGVLRPELAFLAGWFARKYAGWLWPCD
ncbi:MAG: RHS repeat-associated core domain-containing protein [Xanthomonadales bacterium]|nr:RHS repeat-associated core domain-containing protein [Xanthomonadales bacterium]